MALFPSDETVATPVPTWFHEGLAQWVEPDGDRDAIAARMNLSIEVFAQWAARSDIAALLLQLRRLTDQRAELIVSRARIAAAQALLRIAITPDGKETARKACVDLLNMRAEAPPGATDTPRTPEPEHATLDTFHVLLEKLGESLEHHPHPTAEPAD